MDATPAPAKRPLAIHYKIIIGCIIGFAPVLGCFVSIFIPTHLQKTKVAQSEAARANVALIAESVQSAYAQTCQFPPDLPPLFDINACCGGKDCSFDPQARQSWEAAQIPLPPEEGPFSFEAEFLDNVTYRIRATTSYRCDPSIHHSYEVILQPTGECSVTIEPGTLRNEFN